MTRILNASELHAAGTPVQIYAVSNTENADDFLFVPILHRLLCDGVPVPLVAISDDWLHARYEELRSGGDEILVVSCPPDLLPDLSRESANEAEPELPAVLSGAGFSVTQQSQLRQLFRRDGVGPPRLHRVFHRSRKAFHRQRHQAFKGRFRQRRRWR